MVELVEPWFLESHISSLYFLPYLQGWASDGPPAELNIMAQSTSIQRVQRLIDSVPLTNLLFTLLSTSYKKVLGLFSCNMLVVPFWKFCCYRWHCIENVQEGINFFCVLCVLLNKIDRIERQLLKYFCFNQACVLQRQRKGSVSSDASASTDSNTYYEDDFSSTEEDSSQGALIFFDSRISIIMPGNLQNIHARPVLLKWNSQWQKKQVIIKGLN